MTEKSQIAPAKQKTGLKGYIYKLKDYMSICPHCGTSLKSKTKKWFYEHVIEIREENKKFHLTRTGVINSTDPDLLNGNYEFIKCPACQTEYKQHCSLIIHSSRAVCGATDGLRDNSHTNNHVNCVTCLMMINWSFYLQEKEESD